MSDSQLDTGAYWNNRLAGNVTLQGTGHRAFSMAYNQWLYRAQLDSLALLFGRAGVGISGRRVLDIGSGSGFFVDHYLRSGAASVHGLDIAEASIAHLRREFPGAGFCLADIASPDLRWPDEFPSSVDLISAVSVLYHVVDDAGFALALDRLCGRLAPGGVLVLNDTFQRPWTLVASHARFRTMAEYETVFRRHALHVKALIPMYYLMNRAFVPLLGPIVISALGLGRLFYDIDARLRELGWGNAGGLKFLMVQKTSADVSRGEVAESGAS